VVVLVVRVTHLKAELRAHMMLGHLMLTLTFPSSPLPSPACPPAVVFSGFGCAHRVLCDLGKQPTLPLLDQGYNAMLNAVRDRS